MSNGEDFSQFSMLDLFRMEVESQAAILNHGLLALEIETDTAATLNALMRSAHSIKGAARIVDLDVGVKLAHLMEDCFVTAQSGTIALGADQVDILLQGVDWLLKLAQVPAAELEQWLHTQASALEALLTAIAALQSPTALVVSAPNELAISPPPTQVSDLTPVAAPEVIAIASVASEPLPAEIIESPLDSPTIDEIAVTPQPIAASPTEVQPITAPTANTSADRVVRVSADNLNRLMGLAGEALVAANWLEPFSDSLLKLRQHQTELGNLLDKLQTSLAGQSLNKTSDTCLSAARQHALECRQMLSDRLSELELFSRRSANLSDRLYQEVINSHMRPFADGVQAFPRMVRDLARQLDKQIKLEIIGKSTEVDRDILEKIEGPLTHLLRNAIDHGIESVAERQAAGKPPEGKIRLEATHRAGMLLITVSDDGRGIHLEKIREAVVDKQLVSADMATRLTEAELLEFLFLPGFSTGAAVTEISGRGVGLDVVQSMVQSVGGTVRAVSHPGKGMTFHLQLPLTLSVIRTLLVEIGGEPYAFPLTRVDRIVRVEPSAIAVVENRQYFSLDQENIGLIAACQVLDLPETAPANLALPTVVLSDRYSRYGLVVDRLIGEHNLVVCPLDARLGKVKNISAAALLEDGTPVLVLDVEDMVRSIDQLLTSGELSHINHTADAAIAKAQKRVLVVDDSITVREMERKLLQNRGYAVEVAVNGIDGWNATRTGHFDLVITDIDMPRMNGIELVSQLKNHSALKSLPVIIVSYKDREEDRLRGLEVGADYYLTKSSFHDDTLLNAVRDLIGEATG